MKGKYRIDEMVWGKESQLMECEGKEDISTLKNQQAGRKIESLLIKLLSWLCCTQISIKIIRSVLDESLYKVWIWSKNSNMHKRNVIKENHKPTKANLA